MKFTQPELLEKESDMFTKTFQQCLRHKNIEQLKSYYNLWFPVFPMEIKNYHTGFSYLVEYSHAKAEKILQDTTD